MKKLKIILGFSICLIIFSFSYKSKYNINDTYIEGIIDKYSFDGNKMNLEVLGKERIMCKYYFDNLEEKGYYLKNIKYGEKVYLKGNMKVPNSNTNFKMFNYKNYLLSKKIYYVFNIDEIEIKKKVNIFYKIKNYLFDKISKKESPYLYSFILGDSSYIEDDVKESIQNNGISHLLAISGMHITFLFNGLYNLFNRIKKSKFNLLIINLLLVLYLFLVGFSASSIRAGVMFLVTKYKKIKPLYLLSLLFIFLLIYNPYYIYSLGFLLSFNVTFYLILFSKLIEGNYFKKLLITSFISFIAGLPIVIYNFNSINLLSIFLNILFVPLISYIIFPLSFVCLIFKIDSFYMFFTNLFEQMSLFFQRFGFNLILKDISFFTIIYIILGILLLFNLSHKKYYILYFGVLFIHSLLFNFNFSVTYLDVGQGDSILIEFPFNKSNILIDTGGNMVSDEWKKTKYSISKSLIIPYVKKRGIKKIDYLVLTHGDYDHMGEAINLVNNFNVGKVILNCGDFNDLEKDLINVLVKNKIPYSSCINELDIDEYKLKFLNTREYNNENDNSSVIYLNYNSYKFLFMGDASVSKEKDILKKYNLKDIDFLKVGHHGSKSSSSKYFIDLIRPKYSIISVGKNNMYGHPNDKVLNNLSHSKVYRTDNYGGIMVKVGKNGYRIRTCKS